MSLGGIFRPGMRAYFIPFTAGVVLCASAFLPWVIVSGIAVTGVPDVPGLWIVGLGALSSVLAFLSLLTRKNSRHPLLLVGLTSFAIMFLSWRILPRTAGERALTISQAFAIVENTPLSTTPDAAVGSGIYLGMVASAVIAAFGMTIVIRRVQRPYAIVSPDDDVE